MGDTILKNKLYVVGMGPGAADRMSIRADETLKKCDTIIGYTVYVNLLKEDYPGKEYLTTPMTQEARRCEMAFEEAQKGKTVAMVCSGDAGVYGMSGLMLEIGAGYPDIEVEVIPGVTAALSGGAVLGAPLTHDFAVVSLSDRLTPWEKIEKRLRLAAVRIFRLPFTIRRARDVRITCRRHAIFCFPCFRQTGSAGQWKILAVRVSVQKYTHLASCAMRKSTCLRPYLSAIP